MPEISDTARDIFNKAKRAPHGIRVECASVHMAIKLAKRFRAFTHTERKRKENPDPAIDTLQARVIPHEENPHKDPNGRHWVYFEPIDYEYRKALIEAIPPNHLKPNHEIISFEEIPE